MVYTSLRRMLRFATTDVPLALVLALPFAAMVWSMFVTSTGLGAWDEDRQTALGYRRPEVLIGSRGWSCEFCMAGQGALGGTVLIGLAFPPAGAAWVGLLLVAGAAWGGAVLLLRIVGAIDVRANHIAGLADATAIDYWTGRRLAKKAEPERTAQILGFVREFDREGLPHVYFTVETPNGTVAIWRDDTVRLLDD